MCPLQDKDRKRNRLLVPYGKLDEATRKSNEDTALESVRTIIALGCTIAPPTDTGGDIRQLARKFTDSQARIRTFRGQTCYTLTSGKWWAWQCCDHCTCVHSACILLL